MARTRASARQAADGGRWDLRYGCWGCAALNIQAMLSSHKSGDHPAIRACSGQGFIRNSEGAYPCSRDFGPPHSGRLVQRMNGCFPSNRFFLRNVVQPPWRIVSAAVVARCETTYWSCVCLPLSSYTPLRFHMAKIVAAIFRAIVSLARLGFVPADSSRS